MKTVLGFFVSKNECIAHNGDRYKQLKEGEFILDFLIKYENYINCFYNLSYNVACILSKCNLGEDKLKKLYTDQKVQVRDYQITYISGRYFAIKRGDDYNAPYVQFCDVSQYIPWMSVDENFALEYVLSKAKEAQDTGKQVYDALVNLGLSPDKGMVSPIRVYEKEVLSKLSLPTYKDMPIEAASLAYECCKSGWVEAFKKGHFEQTIDYDRSSSYGAGLAELIDIRLGKWWESQIYEPTADYGYLAGEITVDVDFAPFIFSIDDGEDAEHYSVVGTWDFNLTKDTLVTNEDGMKQIIYRKTPYCITKKQYEVLLKYKLGEVKIYNAWWFKADKYEYPYRDMVNNLYEAKEKASGMGRDIPKKIIVGIFGKSLEKRDKGFAQWFNPCYGAEVEMNTKLQVFEDCMANNVVPLSIAVDGILVDKPMDLRMDQWMGSWKKSFEGKALVVSSGVVAVEGNNPTRNFSLDYEWWIDKIKESPESNKYSKDGISGVSLEKAVNKVELSKLGTVETAMRTIDVGYENKRCYFDVPITGQDLLENTYESVSWDISHFAIDKQ